MLGGYGLFGWPGEVYAFGMFQGIMDEVRVFNVVRTATEISDSIDYSGSVTTMPGLVRLYPIRVHQSALSTTLVDTTGMSAGCMLPAPSVRI